MQNRFIIFEGLDGSGKSTQVSLLSKKLNDLKKSVYMTMEPTNGPLGSIIRNAFLNRIDLEEEVIASLFAADRLDHILNKVNGMQEKYNLGYNIICDRYYFSSCAYHVPFLSLDEILSINSRAINLMVPDIVIFIDTDPENCWERLINSRDVFDSFENLNRLKETRKNYMEAFKRFENKLEIILINGNQNTEDVHNEIWNQIKHLF